VAEHGPELENVCRVKNFGNPAYAFLAEPVPS
jgi:hypothetical protein